MVINRSLRPLAALEGTVADTLRASVSSEVTALRYSGYAGEDGDGEGLWGRSSSGHGAGHKSSGHPSVVESEIEFSPSVASSSASLTSLRSSQAPSAMSRSSSEEPHASSAMGGEPVPARYAMYRSSSLNGPGAFGGAAPSSFGHRGGERSAPQESSSTNGAEACPIRV